MADHLTLWVKNYGPGVALGVDAVVHFEPGETLRYIVQTTGIASGEDYLVTLENGELPPLVYDNLRRERTHVHLVGTCTDSAANVMPVDTRVPLAEGTSYPGMQIVREVLERERGS
jgi:hypothetical protein